MTVQRSSGFISTTLRSLLLLLMMMVGVGEMWGQPGIWYIANSSSGNAPAAEYTYNANSPENNYYLVPAADPRLTNKRDAYYSEDNYVTAGDPARPFITTYKTAMDNNSIWLISQSNETGFYYIIHAATGKYLIYEPPHSSATNRKSMHLQTVDNGTYSLSTNNNFKFEFNKSGIGYTIRPYSVSSGNKLFNVANRNFNRYYGSAASKNNFDHEGLVGLYESGHVWVLKDASDADFVKPDISDVDASTGTFTISFPTVSITYPYTTPLTEDIKALGITSIIYTTNDDEPTVGGATTKTYSSAVWLGESCTVKARGVYGNGSMTPVVSKSFDNISAVCAPPAFTYNHTDKTVTITSLGPTDATFYYTLNGDNPTATVSETNFQYASTPIAIPDNCNVVMAIGVRDDFANSIVSSISRVETPTIGSNAQGITISSATEGASIFYTTDGSDPTTDSTPYVGAINLPSGTTIKAIAVKDGYIHSSIVSFTSLLPPEIHYNVANNIVVITNATEGATVYYTTGTTESDTPDPNGSEKIEYTYGNSGFELGDNVNFIKAIAVKGSYMSPEAQLPIVIHVSTAEVDRPYLIQSVECTDFYVLPGDIDKNIIYLNTSSLGRASMEWCFYYAGNEDGVDYYIIKNKNHTTNPYLRSNTNWISLQTANTYTSASEADKKDYWFSIVYANTASNPGYYIHPYNATAGKGLSKKGGNNTADALELADATIETNSFARWNFIPSANKPETTLPFVPWGEEGQNKYYKIINCDGNSNFIIPPTKTVAYAAVSNVSDPNNSMLWYFDEAAHDDWVTYYHIVNAATGEYLYFKGDNTKTDNSNAFTVKGELVTSAADRYLFAFAKTITANQYYILPKVLQNITKNNYSLMYGNGTALNTKATRAETKGKWTFEESDVSLICVPPVISLATDGNVTLSPRTRHAILKYTVGNDSQQTFDNSSNPITTLSERDVVKIVTETTLGETSTVKTVTVIYKPTIEFDPDESIVYNGRTHAPKLSSVNGLTNLISHCVVTSGDINAGPANAVITQKEDETEYVIYGTKEFTIERSPLTIAADEQTMEYGEQAPTEWTYKTSGLAYIDDVTVQLECTPGESLGSYPITFSNLVNKTVKYEIKRNNSDASSNYTDITLIPSFLYVVPKSIGNGILPAEHINISLTGNTPIVTFTKTGGEIPLTEDIDYTYVEAEENSRKEVIWTISGKGDFRGSAQVARVKPTFVGNGGTANPTEYIAAFNGSLDWTPVPAEWNPTSGSKKIWMVTSVNPVVGVVRVKPVTYLPKDMPVLLTSGVNESTGIDASPKSNDTESVSDSERDHNLLKVVPEKTEDPRGIEVHTAEVYVFYNKPGGGTGEFVLALEGWLPSGKFYIDNPNYSSTGSNSSNAPAYLQISWGESTAIPEVHNDVTIERGDAHWYSIDGRRLKGKPTAKGLYIVNGKKVIVK